MVTGYILYIVTKPGLLKAHIKNPPERVDFCDNQIIYLLDFFSALAFGDSIKPFFFKVLRAEVETLHFTFWPLMIKVLFDTFGLNTLRVWRWENDTL